MTNIRSKSLILLITLLLVPELSWSCGAAEVCSDLLSSLVATEVIDGVRLSWSTDSEDSSVDYYKIKRHNCGNPDTCSQDVTTVTAVGTCEEMEDYVCTDYPSAPFSQWTYTVEVWKPGSVRACGVDATVG